MEYRKISEIKIPFAFRRDLGDIKGLAESIRRLGLFPGSITVTRHNDLIFGFRCLRACELLGCETVPVEIWEGPPNGFSNGKPGPASDCR